ncbi:MAG: hypothetical protein J2P50_15450 [Hyphomicrobiaceae bacterium]|nr:hypothetical protein [Hyphomicrobiaceae bacterium]
METTERRVAATFRLKPSTLSAVKRAAVAESRSQNKELEVLVLRGLAMAGMQPTPERN